MSDAAQANLAKYKAGFGKTKIEFVKVSPLKIVPAFSAEMLAQLGMKQTSYPTPVNSRKK